MAESRDPVLQESASWEPGHRVGDYRLLSRLGGGGMGVVFAAAHVATGARHAIKVLLTTDPDLRARFRREAEAMARTDRHPNIVRVHSVGEQRGRPYIVMEHLTGGDLADRLRGGPLAPAEAVSVVRALCHGLEHVHAHGVLHRDLKPANVIFDESGCPKLMDFGLARGPTDGALTRTGEIVGTPSFMAPEQAEGRSDAQDVRTDVYGLGALFYNTLAGRPPFEGGSLIGVLERVMREPPAPPSAHAPGVPRALDAVCLRALAKRPEDRFADVAELRRALEQALAAPASPGGRATSHGMRAGAVAGVAGAIVVAFVALRSPDPGRPVVATTDTAPAASTIVTVTETPTPASVAPTATPTRRLPATIADIPPPPTALPQEVRGLFRDLLWVDLDQISDPASGVAVAVASELTKLDPALAASYLRFAAEGSTNAERAGLAWLELGKLFERGKGVADDDGQALECFRRSARAGHAGGLIKIAEAQARGWGDEPLDLAAAAATYRKALETRATTVEPSWVEDQVGFGLARIALVHPELVTFEEVEPLLRGAFGRRKEARLLCARLLAALKDDVPGATRILEDLIERDDHPEAHAQRALLLLPTAPERADELLAGPRQPFARTQFAWRLWDEGKAVDGVRARAVALLQQAHASGDPLATPLAALCLGRIFILDLDAGRPTSITKGEARRLLLEAAAAHGDVGDEADEELVRLGKR